MRYGKSVYVLCVSATVALAGCQRGREADHLYDNKIFIATDNRNFTPTVRVSEDAFDFTRSVTLSMGKLEERDVTARVGIATNLLGDYRARYGDTEALLLPAEYYTVSGNEAVIRPGQVTSAEPFNIEFTGLNALDFSTHNYVLPVTIESASLGVLKSGRTIYYVVQEASLINVVADLGKENRLWPTWQGNPEPVKDMTAFTMEAMVRIHSFDNPEIATIMGIEDIFLLRVGDASIPRNQLQVAYGALGRLDTRSSIYSYNAPAMQIRKGTWYHIAVTFDATDPTPEDAIKAYINGVPVGSGSPIAVGSDMDTGEEEFVPIDSVDFSVPHSDEASGQPRCFWVGYSYDDKRPLNGQIAEARIWNKALSEEEINSYNHFYKVDPASEGLVAYWKFDDNVAESTTVKDYSPYGNHLTSEKPLTWTEVSLPAKN